MTTPKAPRTTPDPSNRVGWREWVGLPDLGLEWLKVKVDTGARTSALHSTDLREFERDGRPWASFTLHPWQATDEDAVRIEMPILEYREIRSSNGEVDRRPVIRTTIAIGSRGVQADLTLARRDDMDFRMLLGRKALGGTFFVDPGRSYLQGRPPRGVIRRNRGRGAVT